MSLIKWVEFQPLGDDRGSLVALETESIVPFSIKRVYYIFATQKNVATKVDGNGGRKRSSVIRRAPS